MGRLPGYAGFLVMNDTLLIIMAAAVSVSAVAILLQLATLFGMYKAVKAMQLKVAELTPKVDSLLLKANETVDLARKQLGEAAAKANEILDVTKTQAVKVQEMIADASSRAKVQMDRVELVIDDTMGRVQETVATVHEGVIAPIREINGIATGVKAAIQYFFKGGRPNVTQATQDEEMFI